MTHTLCAVAYAIVLAVSQINPAATLRPDAFDAPAPESVAEAARTAPPSTDPQQTPPPPPPEHHHHGGGS
jgi:hypothetical protein